MCLCFQPALSKMKAQCTSKVHEVRDRRISEQETLDQLQEMLDDAHEQVRQHQAAIRHADERLNMKEVRVDTYTRSAVSLCECSFVLPLPVLGGNHCLMTLTAAATQKCTIKIGLP